MAILRDIEYENSGCEFEIQFIADRGDGLKSKVILRDVLNTKGISWDFAYFKYGLASNFFRINQYG
ncbi:hypothetical protein G4V62_13685 [Bacillaceae bacterium SIJ1]|uniref:hypothetical protein n=1 Tax=Litoribacterium kuwaitense TaxID=1398745 RepID=UPI0013E9E3F6|nr:hypothetical protein [Litoribacterium kuwaitense]NGP45946.1 hypothetical protein [Litoribacterium kuwaitense]